MIAWARYPYEGRVALFTGAGSGIGRGIARGFLEQGATVAVLGRTADSLRTTIQDHPEDRSLVLACDATDRAEVGRSVAELLARFGRLDIVVTMLAGASPVILRLLKMTPDSGCMRSTLTRSSFWPGLPCRR